MSQLIPDFFQPNHYFIDEKVNFLKFSNAYKVFDENGTQLGNIIQNVSTGHKAIRLFAGGLKAMMPFTLDIMDMDEQRLITIKRGWTIFMSKIEILDAQGSPIGFIRQKFKFLKPTFNILDRDQVDVASITGDWAAWNFNIEDNRGTNIGQITKKWNGIMKEAFTTADKYIVTVTPEVNEDMKKMAIVATAITIDMVLKESK